MTFEQRDPQLILELADLVAYARLMDAQPLGGGTKALDFSDGNEVIRRS
jgi:hypothetical protein